MRRYRHPYLTVLAGVTAGAVLTACGGGGALDDGGGGSSANGADGGTAGNGEDAGPVTVGLLVPTSGVFAPLGEDMTQGFQLFLDQNAGQLGGREVELEQIDEGGGPDTGIPAAQRLVQQEVNAVVGIVNSAIALGVAELFNTSQIPLIVANAGANDITGAQA